MNNENVERIIPCIVLISPNGKQRGRLKTWGLFLLLSMFCPMSNCMHYSYFEASTFCGFTMLGDTANPPTPINSKCCLPCSPCGCPVDFIILIMCTMWWIGRQRTMGEWREKWTMAVLKSHRPLKTGARRRKWIQSPYRHYLFVIRSHWIPETMMRFRKSTLISNNSI